MPTARLTITTSTLAIALSAFLAAPAAAQTAPGTTPEPGQPDCVDNNNNGVCDPIETTAAPAPAPGATTDEPLVVTGSRIPRRNYTEVEPTITVTSQDIEERGFSTLGQALNEQPAFGVPGATPVGGQSAFGPGQNFVDFFSLGSQRTLTLVNGRRFVGSNTSSIFGPTGSGGSQVDLNIIPTKLIDRVETIAVGGAPIYGSDAIAGTVNIVLRRNYQGIELDGQYGISQRGDNPDYRLRALAGKNFAGGRGNVVVSAEYNKQKGLLFTDRALTRSGDFFGARTSASEPFRNRIFPDRRIPAISDAGIPLVGGGAFGLDFPLSPNQSGTFIGDPSLNFGVNPTGLTSDQFRFDANGNLIPINFGNPTGLPTAFNINASGGNGFSLVPLSNLLSSVSRVNAVTLGQYELTDNVRLFAEGWYTRSTGKNLRDQPEYNSGLFDAAGAPAGNFILSVDNPFLSTAARTAILNSIANNPLSDQNFGLDYQGNPLTGPQNYFYLGRANTDLISGESKGKVEVMRGVLGLDGKINVFGNRELNWEIVGNYGRSKTTATQRSLATRNLLNALDAVVGPNGQIICRPGGSLYPTTGISDAAAPTISTTCAPLNPFGIGQASQAARDYVTGISKPEALNQQAVFTASVAGPIASLPGGSLAFALGYEHRYESQKFDPGAFFRGGPDNTPLVDENGDGNPNNDPSSFGQTVPIVGSNASFNTDEVFGELRAELIGPDNNIPFIRALELKGAARYVNNSLSGGDLTWTAGGRYQPVRDLTIRGNYTRSIRSPSITEFANPTQSFFGFATDPCDQAEVDNGPNPTQRRANCIAAGIANPSTFSALSNQRSFPQGVAGDRSLSAEKADSWTIGALLQPTFLRGFQASVDYVDIKIKDVITDFGADQVLAACYDSSNFASNPFCARTSRDASGQLDFIRTGYANQAILRYKGIIANAGYTSRAPWLGASSKLGVKVDYQYLDTLGSQTVGGTFVNNAGTIGLSKHKGLANFTYDDKVFNALIGFSYLGKAKFSNTNAANFQTPDRVGSVVFVNTAIGFDIAERFQLRFVVDNVFDTKPPYPSPVGGGTVTYFRGILGRYFRAGATVRF
ncbi:TonB-dependent receptor [Sphingomonas rosea]|uniref:TonB-dependent receptor n=1 Tax=Sphingomonas rosea TaxID=335605 RepID=A0ABP7UA16_9SPHN